MGDKYSTKHLGMKRDMTEKKKGIWAALIILKARDTWDGCVGVKIQEGCRITAGVQYELLLEL